MLCKQALLSDFIKIVINGNYSEVALAYRALPKILELPIKYDNPSKTSLVESKMVEFSR